MSLRSYEACMKLFWGLLCRDLMFMVNNVKSYRAHIVDDCCEVDGIRSMTWPTRSPDINPIGHVCRRLEGVFAQRNSTP